MEVLKKKVLQKSERFPHPHLPLHLTNKRQLHGSWHIGCCQLMQEQSSAAVRPITLYALELEAIIFVTKIWNYIKLHGDIGIRKRREYDLLTFSK